jgi:hypothetical protein
MKQFLLFLVFISSTNLFAARQITVTQLPEPLRPLVVSRGADNVRVESKISSTGFFLFVR